MTTLLCALALLPLAQDLKPLPEERKLDNKEQVALELSQLSAGDLGALGWTKTTIERGQTEGETRYVVHRVAELLDFEAPGFVAMESRGVYDAELQLLHELRRSAPLGGKATDLELKWDDEGFRWREGRGKWDAGQSDLRPTVDPDVALFVHGLSIQTPWAAMVFDDKARIAAKVTLTAGEPKTIDDEKMMVFDFDGPSPGRHLLFDNGAYSSTEAETFSMSGMEAGETTERTLRRSLADNETFEKVVDGALPSAWTESKGTYTHATLGLSFKLPKGWTRADSGAAEGDTFRAYSADQNAYVSVGVSLLGTGYTLDGWSEGLSEACKEVAVDGAVKAKKKSLGKTPAKTFEYVFASKAPLDTTMFAWKRNGFGIVMDGGTWIDAPKKLHKETASILKSIKLTR